jgi:calcineurin-like phosphoesterase family protein
MRKVIKYADNSTEVRDVYFDNVCVATIIRQETGKYLVVKHYPTSVWETSRYTDARDYALGFDLKKKAS